MKTEEERREANRAAARRYRQRAKNKEPRLAPVGAGGKRPLLPPDPDPKRQALREYNRTMARQWRAKNFGDRSNLPVADPED